MKLSLTELLIGMFSGGSLTAIINRWAIRRKISAEVDTMDTDNEIKLSQFLAKRLEEMYARIDKQDKRIVDLWEITKKLEDENNTLRLENKLLKSELKKYTEVTDELKKKFEIK